MFTSYENATSQMHSTPDLLDSSRTLSAPVHNPPKQQIRFTMVHSNAPVDIF